MYYFEHTVVIKDDELVHQIVKQGIGAISNFIHTLSQELSKIAEPEENSALLPDDIFMKTLSIELLASVTTAQSAMKQSNTKFFAAPTHEQIEGQIADLMKRRAERLAREALTNAQSSNQSTVCH